MVGEYMWNMDGCEMSNFIGIRWLDNDGGYRIFF